MSRAYQLDALKRANINVSELGCIMLDVEIQDLSEAIPPGWAYASDDPAHWWVKGIQTEGHATLLYGLLPDLVDPLGVDEALDGWERPAVLLGHTLEVFRSPFPEEPYACIVARVDCPELDDAHARLSLLPHIDTHPSYKPHVTLAYVHADEEQRAVDALTLALGGAAEFPTLGLDYGHALRGS